MSGLKFTEEAARRLEAVYLTSDVIAQRAEILRKLEPAEGDSVIDVGCGPGFLCESVASAVGPSGRVTGIDISPDFVRLSESRNSHARVRYRVGDATRLDGPDSSYDAVVCVQVAEYIPDADKALAESLRVLKPGGRAVFVATDWDAVIWHSDAPERMAAVMKSWEAHCAHPRLPRSMCSLLRNVGFALGAVTVFPILNLEWGDETYSKGLSKLVRAFVLRRGEIAEADLTAWSEELQRLSREGRYFFSSSRFIFEASRPL